MRGKELLRDAIFMQHVSKCWSTRMFSKKYSRWNAEPGLLQWHASSSNTSYYWKEIIENSQCKQWHFWALNVKTVQRIQHLPNGVEAYLACLMKESKPPKNGFEFCWTVFSSSVSVSSESGRIWITTGSCFGGAMLTCDNSNVTLNGWFKCQNYLIISM